MHFLYLCLFFLEATCHASCCCSNLPKRFESLAPSGMIWIPGGEFTMGTDAPEARKDERPAHRVKVDGFWIDATPVTNRQFKEFVDATGYVTTAEKPPTLEEIMAQVPPGTKPPASRTTGSGLPCL